MDDSRIRPLLVRFFEAADARAMEQFVEATRPRLIKAARRIGSPQDADDSVQAAYHSLLQRGATIPSGPLFPWLLVATIRIAYRRKAMQQRARDLGDRLAVPSTGPGPLESATQLEEARLVRDAITKLPAHYRDVVVLHYLEGLTAAEAARLLDVSRSTVTTRLLRARRLLRSRLPQLAYALLLLPWLARDGWAAVASAPTTGAMVQGGGIVMAWKTKTLVVVGMLAAAGTGVAIGHTNATARATSSARGPRPDTRSADLQMKLDELRHINRSLQARLAESGLMEPAPEQEAAPAKKQPAVPDIVREAGARMGIDEALIEAAWNFHNSPTPEADESNFEALQRGGKQGFLAYVTLFYAGISSTTMDANFAKLWKPEFAGAEDAVIEFIGLEQQYGYAKWSAYRALGAADTLQSRDFLVRAADTENDAGHYMSLSKALGQLKEARAFDNLARRISNKKWHRSVRASIVVALIRIDPKQAKSVFIEHLRAEDTDLLLTVVNALVRLDADVGQRELAALLAGPRARSLDGETLRGLERLAR